MFRMIRQDIIETDIEKPQDFSNMTMDSIRYMIYLRTFKQMSQKLKIAIAEYLHHKE